jgi:hypothetical protein
MLQYQIDAWKNDIFAESPRVKERYVDIDKYNKYKEIADKAYNEWDAKILDFNLRNLRIYDAKIKYDNEYWDEFETFIKLNVEMFKKNNIDKVIDSNDWQHLQHQINPFEKHCLKRRPKILPRHAEEKKHFIVSSEVIKTNYFWGQNDVYISGRG